MAVEIKTTFYIFTKKEWLDEKSLSQRHSEKSYRKETNNPKVPP